MNRLPDDSFLDESIKFPRALSEEGLQPYLLEKLNASSGDSITYVEILMKFYRQSLTIKNASAPKLTSIVDSGEILPEEKVVMRAELTRDKLESFRNMVNRDYASTMKECVGFTIPTTNLITSDRQKEYYEDFRTNFPRCHSNFALVVSSQYYAVPMGPLNDTDELHKKQRIILLLSCGLIRTKSNRLLSHWAQLEPFGHFFKGHQQSSRIVIGGALTMTLPTFFKNKMNYTSSAFRHSTRC